MEEKILFPAIRQLCGGELLQSVRRLRIDHGAIALLLVPSPTLELIAENRSILEPHNRIEEAPDGLYARCDEMLTSEAEQLLESARGYPDVKVARHRDGAHACRRAQDALRRSQKHLTPK